MTFYLVWSGQVLCALCTIVFAVRCAVRTSRFLEVRKSFGKQTYVDVFFRHSKKYEKCYSMYIHRMHPMSNVWQNYLVQTIHGGGYSRAESVQLSQTF